VNAAKRKLADRAKKIIARLRTTYPDVRCELDHQNPLQLIVATILSAQCTDIRVNKVTPALFARYRTAADFAAAPPGELEELIKSTGFFRNKAKSIRNCCRAIADKHAGQVPVPRWPNSSNSMAVAANLQRRPRRRLSEIRRHRCRHPRPAPLPSTQPHPTYHAGENRTCPDGHRPSRRLDRPLASPHLARPPPVRRTQTGLRALRTSGTLPATRSQIMINEGDKAPAFPRLTALKGTAIVLYFLPQGRHHRLHRRSLRTARRTPEAHQKESRHPRCQPRLDEVPREIRPRSFPSRSNSSPTKTTKSR